MMLDSRVDFRFSGVDGLCVLGRVVAVEPAWLALTSVSDNCLPFRLLGI